jgi:hypothetical protein
MIKINNKKIRNRCNDSLNRYKVHQSVERITGRWQRFYYSLTSQYTLRNHCNDSLNRYNDSPKHRTIYRALATFWLFDQFSDKPNILWKRYNDLWKRYNDLLKCCNGFLNHYTIPKVMNDQQDGDTPSRLLMRHHNMVASELTCLGAHSLINLSQC